MHWGRVPSTRSASLRCARRRRTTSWAPRAVSWTRWRSPQGSAAPCFRSCAGRCRHARPYPCRQIWRSSGGRPARHTTSAARRTAGRGRQPSWERGSWRSPRDGRGPGSANCRPQRWPASPNSSTGPISSGGGATSVTRSPSSSPRRRTRCAPPPPSVSGSTPGARLGSLPSARDDQSVWDTCCGPAMPATTRSAWVTRRPRRPSRRHWPRPASTAHARAAVDAAARWSCSVPRCVGSRRGPHPVRARRGRVVAAVASRRRARASSRSRRSGRCRSALAHDQRSGDDDVAFVGFVIHQ